MFILFFIFAIIFTSSVKQAAGGVTFSDVVSSGWKKFWVTTCEFATKPSERAKRSTHFDLDFPNLEDTDELYNFLYPSLDLKAHDFVRGGRSAEDKIPTSLTAWMDDLIEMWGNECHFLQQSKDDEPRNQDQHKGTTVSSSNSSTSFKLGNSSNLLKRTGLEFTNNTTWQNATSTKVGINGTNAKQDASMIALQGMPPPLFNPVNTFFAPFGGDIEYFFPLVGLGIPFNGDITLLGFHGFKGIFPYRR